MLEPEEIPRRRATHAQPKLLAGRHVLLTAGPTFEAIDPVRGITNTSSGKMGYAIAQAAVEAGAAVTLVSGPTPLATPAGSQANRRGERRRHVRRCGCQPRRHRRVHRGRRGRRLHSRVTCDDEDEEERAPLTITLQPTADILATVAARPNAPYCVGFAAETDDIPRNADEKRRRKKVPLMVANRAQDAFGSDDNEVTCSTMPVRSRCRAWASWRSRGTWSPRSRGDFRSEPHCAANDGAHGKDCAQGSRRANPPASPGLCDAGVRPEWISGRASTGRQHSSPETSR
jgi:hypothetical protein